MSLVLPLLRRRPSLLVDLAAAVVSAAPSLPFRGEPVRSWSLTPLAGPVLRRVLRREMIRALEEHEREMKRERRLRLVRRSLAVGALAAAAAGGMRFVGHASASHDG